MEKYKSIDIAKYFKEARKALGVTQREVAEKLCYSRMYISQVERGKKESAYKVAAALDLLLHKEKANILELRKKCAREQM
jgi:transcriptional regulator with XRE-family HTH domain